MSTVPGRLGTSRRVDLRGMGSMDGYSHQERRSRNGERSNYRHHDESDEFQDDSPLVDQLEGDFIDTGLGDLVWWVRIAAVSMAFAMVVLVAAAITAIVVVVRVDNTRAEMFSAQRQDQALRIMDLVEEALEQPAEFVLRKPNGPESSHGPVADRVAGFMDNPLGTVIDSATISDQNTMPAFDATVARQWASDFIADPLHTFAKPHIQTETDVRELVHAVKPALDAVSSEIAGAHEMLVAAAMLYTPTIMKATEILDQFHEGVVGSGGSVVASDTIRGLQDASRLASRANAVAADTATVGLVADILEGLHDQVTDPSTYLDTTGLISRTELSDLKGLLISFLNETTQE